MISSRTCPFTAQWSLYIVRSKSFRTYFFFNRKYIPYFLIQNKLRWRIYRLLRGRTVSAKLPKLPLLGLFNSSSTASWISATSAKWSPFNFIFNLGNRKQSGGGKSGEHGRGVINGCNIFWGSKIGKHLQLCGRAYCRATRKMSRAERSWTNLLNALIKFCMYCFSIWYEFFVHYDLRDEKKKYQRSLDAGPSEFQILWPRRCLTNPFRNLSLFFGVIGKTPGIISRNNFLKKICLHQPSR